MTLLSVIIPARNEQYLQKTINNVLENIEGDTEIIAVCDGYWPDPPLEDHPRVKIIHHTEAIGQRQSINEAARMSTAEFIMKLDAHCAVDKGFDVKLSADYEPDWTVIPRMYNLDINTWTPKLHKRTDYMYIGCEEGRLLRAEYYNHGQPDTDKLIDDTMCCMGPGFFMSRKRFWELEGCDEKHGSWGQQGVEVACKAWLSGGSLKVNKKTWFAHWFRGGGGPGFPYPISGHDQDKAREYSRDLWLNNKWEKQTRKFEWLIAKFNPPGWEQQAALNTFTEKQNEYQKFFYDWIHIGKREPTWKGIKVAKMPNDLILYQQAIFETKPDFIIETGTQFGGSALFFQDMLDMVGQGGKVITIDKYPPETMHKDPRITYIVSGSTDDQTLATLKQTVGDKKVMVVLDSDHSRRHVKRELSRYKDIVTSGQYLVVEDCFDNQAEPRGPGQALDWFIKGFSGFEHTKYDQQFVVGYTKGGWLKKI